MMKVVEKLSPVLIGILAVVFSSVANGATATAPTGIITSSDDIVALLCGILNWMFWGLVVLGMAMVLIGGYIYATSGGNSEKVGQATKTLTYAAVAIVVALCAKGVPLLVSGFLGGGANGSVSGVCP
jgi:hypothetical protein